MVTISAMENYCNLEATAYVASFALMCLGDCASQFLRVGSSLEGRACRTTCLKGDLYSSNPMTSRQARALTLNADIALIN